MRKQMEDEEEPHLAEGDIIMPPVDTGGSGFDVDGGDSDTKKALPLSPGAMPPPAPPIAAPPAPAMPAPAAAPMAAPARPMPGMPPTVTPDQLKMYLDRQRGAVNKYSPDQQYGQEQALLRARTGTGGALAHAGATFADGIMQGVAGAGNPGFAKAMDERSQALYNDAGSSVDRARKGSMEQVEANQKIDAQDPKSPLSLAYQQAFSPIFSKMGYDPKDVAGMPASQLQTVADLGVRYADAQTQLELKKAMLQVQTLTAMANMANQHEERAHQDRELQKGAAEETLKGSKIPFVGPSHSQKQAASQVLANMATKAAGNVAGAPPQFATEAEAAAAGLPDGAKVTIGGKTGTWRHK